MKTHFLDSSWQQSQQLAEKVYFRITHLFIFKYFFPRTSHYNYMQLCCFFLLLSKYTRILGYLVFFLILLFAYCTLNIQGFNGALRLFSTLTFSSGSICMSVYRGRDKGEQCPPPSIRAVRGAFTLFNSVSFKGEIEQYL